MPDETKPENTEYRMYKCEICGLLLMSVPGASAKCHYGHDVDTGEDKTDCRHKYVFSIEIDRLNMRHNMTQPHNPWICEKCGEEQPKTDRRSFTLRQKL